MNRWKEKVPPLGHQKGDPFPIFRGEEEPGRDLEGLGQYSSTHHI